jgi:hypothetical protein
MPAAARPRSPADAPLARGRSHSAVDIEFCFVRTASITARREEVVGDRFSPAFGHCCFALIRRVGTRSRVPHENRLAQLPLPLGEALALLVSRS